MKILLIEDDDALIALLSRSLTTQHHIVDAVKDGEMGWTYASTFDYDLIILDIMLPKLDGISLCQRLRGEGYTMPILLLTAQDLVTAKVQGLEAGADDYVVKPFDPNELMARVRALLRRSSNNPLPLLSWGDLLLNPSTCEVTYDGRSLNLTTKEYDLLELFLRDSYHVFSSDEIIDRLWSSDSFPAEATVRSHLRRLRHKLQAVGAPHDFISTIHGRGYYLKSLQPHFSAAIPTDIPQAETLDRAPHPILESDLPLQFSQHSEQYLSFLKDTWITTQPECLQRIDEIAATLDRWGRGESTATDLERLQQQAHKLAGTLGVFSLMSAMGIARQIEGLLDLPTPLSPESTTTLHNLVTELRSAIENSAPSPTISVSSPHQPLLLLVEIEANLALSLAAMANDRGLRNVSLSTIEAAYSYLSTIPDEPTSLLSPTVVLVSFVDTLADSIASHPLLGFIHNLNRRFPHWSILVLGERGELQERLAVVRNGGKFLGIAGLTSEQIFTAATSLLHFASDRTKVMVVDDDLDWLRTLPQLLQPWGMKVTTLADPQQFWTVLQLVQPDALVLDIKMPEINGLELCQVLRSDPYWEHLPILFLSVLDNPLAQQEAFSVGADDYLCKPVTGGELAQRIRHRLSRLQAGQVAT
jgi:DNA-binding response OmpR family regulator/HPt (histidine-containing phosphotransfer) domain-containing protein